MADKFLKKNAAGTGVEWAPYSSGDKVLSKGTSAPLEWTTTPSTVCLGKDNTTSTLLWDTVAAPIPKVYSQVVYFDDNGMDTGYMFIYLDTLTNTIVTSPSANNVVPGSIPENTSFARIQYEQNTFSRDGTAANGVSGTVLYVQNKGVIAVYVTPAIGYAVARAPYVFAATVSMWTKGASTSTVEQIQYWNAQRVGSDSAIDVDYKQITNGNTQSFCFMSGEVMMRYGLEVYIQPVYNSPTPIEFGLFTVYYWTGFDPNPIPPVTYVQAWRAGFSISIGYVDGSNAFQPLSEGFIINAGSDGFHRFEVGLSGITDITLSLALTSQQADRFTEYRPANGDAFPLVEAFKYSTGNAIVAVTN